MRILVNTVEPQVDLWYYIDMVKTCKCGKDYDVIPSKFNRSKYCSKECFYTYRTRPSGLKYKKHKENPTSFKKGDIPWNKGMKMKKPSEYSRAYDALHEWAERWVGKSLQCDYCGSTDNLEISNVSGEYMHDKKDWQTLCKKCHHRYDYEMFGARKKFYESSWE